MVPFSFPQTRLKSLVMKEHLTGALDDWLNGFWDKWVQRHAGLEPGALALSCLPVFLIVIPAGARKARKSGQIKVNHTKSNLFFIPTPNS
ncbi:MAG: hypothetical protein ABSF34_12650 [Verrucomicrobiota bacterium]